MADKMSLRTLYQFYRPVVASASGDLATFKSSWKKVLAAVTTWGLFFFSKDIVAATSALVKWQGFSKWWSVVPLAALFAYYLLRANYQKFQEQAAASDAKESTLRQELTAERDRVQQPDVALIWDWPEDVKKINTLKGHTEKLIMIHNRGNQYVYNVQIAPVKLRQELTFDLINEIAPNREHDALGRWDGRSSAQTNYVYFFGNNEQEALDKGWIFKKLHQRGISDSFMKIPMTLTYDSNGAKWQCDFDFVYDIGDESLFMKKSCQRIEASP